MSELKRFLETHRLDHKVKVFTEKEITTPVRLAFKAYGVKDYEYHGYNNLLSTEIKKMFPASACGLDAIIISAYDKTALETIAKLSRTDDNVIKYKNTRSEKTKDMLKSYV